MLGFLLAAAHALRGREVAARPGDWQLILLGTADGAIGPHAQNLAKRFRQHGEAYFRFITTPGIDPTNNSAEQAIRFVVIPRHPVNGCNMRFLPSGC